MTPAPHGDPSHPLPPGRAIPALLLLDDCRGDLSALVKGSEVPGQSRAAVTFVRTHALRDDPTGPLRMHR